MPSSYIAARHIPARLSAIMFELSQIVSLSYYFVICVALRWLYLALTQFWWLERGSKPELVYQADSKHVRRVVEACSALRERYVPPFLWGKSGHIQTFIFGAIGRFLAPTVSGDRHSLILPDGSTVYFDVYEPESLKHSNVIMFVCPGIGNSSETDYIRGFTHYARSSGYRVVVFNHLGALDNEKLTGNRIFTYGGTGDIAAVFEELCHRYPQAKFVGMGFSLGACVLVRFLGEDVQRQKKFICATSICQGYDPNLIKEHMSDWTHFRRFYNYKITTKQIGLVRRHSQSLLSPTPPSVTSQRPRPQHSHRRHVSDTTHNTSNSAYNTSDSTHSVHKYNKSLWSNESDLLEKREEFAKMSRPLRTVSFSSFQSTITHDGHDCNGYSLDSSRRHQPNKNDIRAITSMKDFDEYYSRRALGFSSIDEMYNWVSCVKLLHQIKELPMLITNAIDDPLVVKECHEIPKKYIDRNPNALFVQTEHGGHLGFFEGGILYANDVSWIDRLLLQYADACIELSNDEKLQL